MVAVTSGFKLRLWNIPHDWQKGGGGKEEGKICKWWPYIALDFNTLKRFYIKSRTLLLEKAIGVTFCRCRNKIIFW
jgi:hypothetical protein